MSRRPILIGVAAALVVLLAWYFFLWKPRSDEIADARDRTEAAETQAQQLESEIQRIRAAQRDEPLRRAQLETLRAAIPDDPNLAQFILDTNDAAAKAGIEFISIAPTPPAAAAPPQAPATGTTTGATTATTAPGAAGTPPAEIKVALQVQGGYFQVLDFMNRLTDLPRLLVIDSVAVTADQNGRLSVNLQSRMFTRELPAGFGGTTTTTTTPGATTTTAPGATTTTVAGGATTTTAAGGATATTSAAAPTTTIAGAQP